MRTPPSRSRSSRARSWTCCNPCVVRCPSASRSSIGTCTATPSINERIDGLGWLPWTGHLPGPSSEGTNPRNCRVGSPPHVDRWPGRCACEVDRATGGFAFGLAGASFLFDAGVCIQVEESWSTLFHPPRLEFLQLLFGGVLMQARVHVVQRVPARPDDRQGAVFGAFHVPTHRVVATSQRTRLHPGTQLLFHFGRHVHLVARVSRAAFPFPRRFSRPTHPREVRPRLVRRRSSLPHRADASTSRRRPATRQTTCFVRKRRQGRRAMCATWTFRGALGCDEWRRRE
mmetsp:Transcript_5544/g.34315  ORF Transcript_5544/g.34315 Transcript_5544/m.34315 type:complete len:286 (-) Transcript_5544:100-957(-)